MVHCAMHRHKDVAVWARLQNVHGVVVAFNAVVSAHRYDHKHGGKNEVGEEQDEKDDGSALCPPDGFLHVGVHGLHATNVMAVWLYRAVEIYSPNS